MQISKLRIWASIRRLCIAFCFALLAVSACSQPEPASTKQSANLHSISLGDGEQLRVVATISIIGDVVKQIGGDDIALTVLIQPGQDPHGYEPPASAAGAIERAHVVFTNGFNLEENLTPLLDASGSDVVIVEVSHGITPISNSAFPEHGGVDPHVWQNPQNVMVWADNIASALSTLDPRFANSFKSRAEDYKKNLAELDSELERRLAVIPAERRKLVTNHDALEYFAKRYNFKLVGTVMIGASDVSEPSAGDIARLVETIKAENVTAIFVENTFGDQLARTVAGELGRPIQVLTLFTDALDQPGKPADNYIGMMRANCDTILKGLGAQAP